MNYKTILLIEDNPSDVDLTKRALETAHLLNELTVVSDGEEALDYLFATGAYADRDPSDLPSLTLLDLKLPKVSGLDVLKRIRANAKTRRLRVVILTSSCQEHDLAASYDSGVSSYIRKPVDSEQFLESVAKLQLYWLELNEPPPQVR